MNNIVVKMKFHGVELIDVDIETILEMIKSVQIGCADYMVTPNVDHFYKLDCGDHRLKSAYDDAKYIVCDSRIVRILSILENERLRNVVPGSDLTKRVLSDPWFSNKRIGVIGGAKADIDLVAKRFGLLNVSHYNPPMGFINNNVEVDLCIDFVNQTPLDYLFLAVGCPQQEILAREIHLTCKSNTEIKLIFCVGASFDFLTGRAKRAPLWVQKLNLEWFYRAMTDVNRLMPRYARNLKWVFNYISIIMLNKIKNVKDV